MSQESNVISLDSKRDIATVIDILKNKMNAKQIVVLTINNDETFGIFIENEIMDIDLCYLIDCLQEQRKARLSHD